MVTANADVNQGRKTSKNEILFPLHIAICNGHAETVKVLVEANADVNKCYVFSDESTLSPLDIAKIQNHMATIMIIQSLSSTT